MLSVIIKNATTNDIEFCNFLCNLSDYIYVLHPEKTSYGYWIYLTFFWQQPVYIVDWESFDETNFLFNIN